MFACGYLVFPAPFIEEMILFLLCTVSTLVKGQLTVYAWVYFQALYCVPLVYMSVFMQIPYCFNYRSLITYFEIRNCDASGFVLPFQAYLALHGPLWCHVNFRIVHKSTLRQAD